MSRLLFLCIFGLTACSQINSPVVLSNHLNWLDLSHSYDNTTLYWPNNIKGFEHITEAEGKTSSGYYYSSYSICTPEHGGTHLDAPIHFAENKLTVDKIPLSSLTGNAIVIDVSRNALADRDYQVSVDDIENWEEVDDERIRIRKQQMRLVVITLDKSMLYLDSSWTYILIQGKTESWGES